MDFKTCKLEIFIPATHLKPLQQALREVDAGHIGRYDCCLSYGPVTGCWRPLEGTSPYIGQAGEISAEPELKVEVTVPIGRLDEAIAAVKTVHPYEEPVINAVPLLRTGLDAPAAADTRQADRRLAAALNAFRPWNRQEERDRAEILRRLDRGEQLWTRENTSAHLTASAWVVSPDRTRALMCFHRLYNSWAWLGGHADGETDLLQTALREAREESGLTQVVPVSEDIFSLEILTVDGHEKRGDYVSSHLHLNVTYVLEADPGEKLRVKPDENSGLAWFGLDEAVEKSTEPWFRERIYSKLNAKLRALAGGSISFPPLQAARRGP